jgi:uncharacterized protein YcnI
MIMKKLTTMFMVCLLSTMLISGLASAHIGVFPNEAIQGTFETFTFRVPSEKDIPNIKVEVKIPAEVDISRVEPKVGWKYDFTKDSTDKITSVIWTSDIGLISSKEFTEFKLQGKVEATATQITWKSIQTYKDGSLAEWVGAPDSESPAPVTKVNPVPANAKLAADGDMDMTDSTTTATSTKIPLYLSIAALLLAIVAVGLSFRQKTK